MRRRTWRFLVVFLSTLGLTASATAADLERYVHTLVNEYRTAHGLTPLTFSPDIAAIARQHSWDMATGRVGVGHGGADRRGAKISQSLPSQGFAENVAYNTRSGAAAGQTAVSGWIQSPGHRRNMEGAFDLTGIGIAHGPRGISFFTQLFVKTPAYRPGTAQPSSSQRPPRRPRREKDPRQRPGRKRTADGWVQQLD